MYGVSQKIRHPLWFSDIFSQMVGIFNQFFYIPIVLYFLH